MNVVNRKSKTYYRTYQALHHEERAADDGLSYYYVSFMMAIDSARAIHLVKFSADNLRIVWHIQKVVNDNADDIPWMIGMDTNNLREFYLFGLMRYSATSPSVSVAQRVNKLDGKILH